MVDCDQEKTTTETVDVSLKRKQLLSNAMKRTSDWYVPETYIFLLLLTSLDRMRIHEKGKKKLVSCSCYRIFSQEIPSDVTVEVGGASFQLHKVTYQYYCY